MRGAARKTNSHSEPTTAAAVFALWHLRCLQIIADLFVCGRNILSSSSTLIVRAEKLFKILVESVSFFPMLLQNSEIEANLNKSR